MVTAQTRITRIEQLDTSREAEWEDLEVRGVNLTASHIRGLTIRGCIFTHCTFSDTVLASLHVRDTTFTDCNLSNGKWIEAVFDDVAFETSKLTGLRISDGVIRGLTITNCKADVMQLQGARCRDVRCADTDFQYAYFDRADLRQSSLLRCDLGSCDFSHTQLWGSDVRGSKIELARIDPAKWKGVTVDVAQALYLIQLMGLKLGE